MPEQSLDYFSASARVPRLARKGLTITAVTVVIVLIANASFAFAAQLNGSVAFALMLIAPVANFVLLVAGMCVMPLVDRYSSRSIVVLHCIIAGVVPIGAGIVVEHLIRRGLPSC